MAKLRLGALEAGGTKMVCAIGDENGEIYEQISIPTTTPKETIPKMIAYFRGKGIDALGIACFGPIELDRDSEKYGYITTTPKLACPRRSDLRTGTREKVRHVSDHRHRCRRWYL